MHVQSDGTQKPRDLKVSKAGERNADNWHVPRVKVFWPSFRRDDVITYPERSSGRVGRDGAFVGGEVS